MPKQQLTPDREEKVLDLREDIVRICQNLRIDAADERLKTIINAIQRALSLSINDPIIIDAYPKRPSRQDLDIMNPVHFLERESMTNIEIYQYIVNVIMYGQLILSPFDDAIEEGIAIAEHGAILFDTCFLSELFRAFNYDVYHIDDLLVPEQKLLVLSRDDYQIICLSMSDPEVDLSDTTTNSFDLYARWFVDVQDICIIPP